MTPEQISIVIKHPLALEAFNSWKLGLLAEPSVYEIFKSLL